MRYASSTPPTSTLPVTVRIVWEVGEQLVPVFRDEHDVLDTAASEAATIDAGLDRDDVTRHEDLTALVERRGLVEIQAETMAQVVDEAVLKQVQGAWSRRVAYPASRMTSQRSDSARR